MTKVALHTDKFWVRDELQKISEGNSTLSRALKEKLVELGFLVPKNVKIVEGRGRPQKTYELSGKGRGHLAISKSWKRENVKVEDMTRAQLEAEVKRLRAAMKSA